MRDKLVSAARLSITGMLRSRWAGLLIALASILVSRLPLAASDPPSPAALLRGVEAVRTKAPSLKATLEIRYILPPPATTIECLVELDRDKRRFEVFAGKVPGQVIIRQGDEFHGFVRKKYSDVEIYDLQEAYGTRGDVAFDPRVLGLNELMPCNVNVKDCLWYDKARKLEVIGQESLHGVKVWRVRAIRDNVTSDYWIEEPSFRVHRRTLTRPGTQIAIESEFGLSPSMSPFPIRIISKLDNSARKYEVIYIVKSFEAGAHIAPERFTIKSMRPPVNTMINDYRIDRIVGYWDGEGISKDPVYPGQKPKRSAPPPLPKRQNRLLLIALNVFVVLALVIAILWRWRRRLTSAK